MGRITCAVVVLTFAISASSCRSDRREDVGNASLAQAPTVAPPEAGFRLRPGDYNGDGLVDLVWRDHAGNRIWVWLMAGTEPFERGPAIPGPPGDDWAVIGSYGDLNADGMSEPGLAQPHHQPDGRVADARDGAVRARARIPGPPGDGWICVPALDFNLDGMADVLWFNPTTNRMAVWLMRGTEPFERGPESRGRRTPAGSPWSAPTSTATAWPTSSGTTRRRRGWPCG